MRAFAAAIILLALSLSLSPSHASAQDLPSPRAELRADIFVARTSAVQLGAGVVLAPDPYVRVALIAAGGASVRSGESGGSARAEGDVRFLLDPYSERRLGLYFGAGPIVRWDRSEQWRALLGFIIGLEGNPKRSWVPAVEAGFGGGARVGFVLRRGKGGAR